MPDGFVDEPVVGGLDQPVNLAFLPDGRCLVIERVPGRVRLIVDGALSPLDPGLTVDSLKTDNEERGLLRIAVDPSWPARPYAYVYFTHAGRVCPAPDRVVPGQLNRPRVEGLQEPASMSTVGAGLRTAHHLRMQANHAG